MSLSRVWWLLGIMSSGVAPAVNADFSEVCELASCHPQRDIQHTALMQRKRERHAMAGWESEAGPRTVRLLLSEMEGLAKSKGIDGLDPEEVEHIQTIKGLIADTIIPSILDGAEESRQEIAELYAAMMNCSGRATSELDSESTLHTTVDQYRTDHKDCREREDHFMKEKDRVCRDFNLTSTSIQLPAGEMPGLEADHATMIQYLKTMDEHFCGRMDTFKEEWDKCEDLKDNLTTTSDECVTKQQDLEETWCLWRTELEGTCEGFSACWNTSAARFYERKTAIEQLVDERKEALKGAMTVQCLWDAWEWDREPCTVNETKVKECKELQPNTSSVEVDIPSPPPPLPCDASDAGYFPCTEAYVASEYGSLDVSQALIDQMREACSACPPVAVEEDSKDDGLIEIPAHDIELRNAEHVAGHTYKDVGTSFYPIFSLPTYACVVTVAWKEGITRFNEATVRLSSVRYDLTGGLVIKWKSSEITFPSFMSPTVIRGSSFSFKERGDNVTVDWCGEKLTVSLRGKVISEGPNRAHPDYKWPMVLIYSVKNALWDVTMRGHRPVT